MNPNTIITLNVGGRQFQTTYKTYRQLTVGARSTEYIPVGSDGTSFFIDRDPTWFRFILTFAREGVMKFAFGVTYEELSTEMAAYGFGCCYPKMRKCKIHDPEGQVDKPKPTISLWGKK